MHLYRDLQKNNVLQIQQKYKTELKGDGLISRLLYDIYGKRFYMKNSFCISLILIRGDINALNNSRAIRV